MPEISSKEYLNALLTAYQNAEKNYSQAVSDVVAAEIRRDEAKTVKEEAFNRLEEAREKYGSDSPEKSLSISPGTLKKRGIGKHIFSKRVSKKSPPPVPPPLADDDDEDVNKVKPPVRKPSTGQGTSASSFQSERSSTSDPSTPKLGSRKAPKIFSRDNDKSDQPKRNTSKIIVGPLTPIYGSKNVLEICKGRTKDWFEENIECDKLGLVNKFYQASFGTKTNEKTKEVHVYSVVLNDEWNDLVTTTSETQVMYIGKGPTSKPTLRDRAAEALVSPPQKDPVALFFAPKNSQDTDEIFYVGHWKVSDGKMLVPPRSVKGQLRQCLAKFEFVGVDENMVKAISRD